MQRWQLKEETDSDMLSRALLLAAPLLAAAHNPHDVIAATYASDDGELVLAISRGLLFRSEDGGFVSPSAAANPRPAAQQVAHARGRLARSQNWAFSHSGLPNPVAQHTPGTFVGQVESAKRAGTVFFQDGAHVIWKSTDSGKNWYNTNSLPDMRRNKAAHWTPHNKTIAPTMCMSPWYQTDNIVLATHGYRTLLRSTNGARAFEYVATEAPQEFVSVACAEDGFYAGTTSGKVYRSLDRGKTWGLAHTHGNTPITSLVPVSQPRA